MARDLPSLEALRVFEAAARHLSFTRASQELCVTQGAVSQRIKLLEGQLGVALFKRNAGRLLLTDAGQDLARCAAEALDVLTRGVQKLRDGADAGPLTVTMMPSFAAAFLAPRLGRLLRDRPDLDLRLHTSFEVMDLRRDGVDLAVRHGQGHYPGLHVELLVREDMFAICSPDWAARLKTPADLAQAPLIRDQDVPWESWLKGLGMGGLKPTGPSFLDSHLAMQAAVDGAGIALGRSLVAADHLAAGRLVRPFAHAVPAPQFYWLVRLPERIEDARINTFCDWLKGEVAAALQSK